jgi:hypothetical protein
MDDDKRAAAIRGFWESIESRDWGAARALLADDCVVEWPHSRERFDGADDFIEMNRAYPEGWRITVLRVVARGDVTVSEIRVDQDPEVYFAASFFEFGPDDRVVRIREHWVTSPYEEPPAWRAQWSRPYDVGP